MNRESFERLSPEKRKIIERAYFAAYNKDITHSDFFSICRQSLTPEEYASLFAEARSRTAQDSPLSTQPIQPTRPDHPAHPRPAAPTPPRSAPLPGAAEPLAEPRPQQEIKTEHIEDIMQYSGIDLKEEAEHITRDAEHNIIAPSYDDTDLADQPASLVIVPLYREFVVKTCATRGMKPTEEAVRLLFRALRRKLLDVADKMDEACRIRNGGGLVNFGFHIDNEMSKQLWYLNELERAKLERLSLRKDEDPKKKRVIQEREDLLIKKKQSNSVAMAAMGLKHRSWMLNGDEQATEEGRRFTPLYSPFDEKAFEESIRDRQITMKDLIYVLERDQRYSKSVFLIQHYFKS